MSWHGTGSHAFWSAENQGCQKESIMNLTYRCQWETKHPWVHCSDTKHGMFCHLFQPCGNPPVTAHGWSLDIIGNCWLEPYNCASQAIRWVQMTQRLSSARIAGHIEVLLNSSVPQLLREPMKGRKKQGRALEAHAVCLLHGQAPYTSPHQIHVSGPTGPFSLLMTINSLNSTWHRVLQMHSPHPSLLLHLSL